MAFQTIPGTGGAPDSYVGTSGVDSVTITNNNSAVDLVAYDSNDIVNVANASGVVNGYTLKGGSGNDVFTANTTTIAGNSFFNGNAGNDVIALNAFNSVSVTSSAIRGGQGNDTLALTGSANVSLVNGNMDDDTITTAAASNSSIFGGQGVDTLNIGGATVLTVINGDRDNDRINLGNVAGSTLNQSTVYGGAGNDTITVLAGLATSTDTSIYGGEGNDTLNGAAAVVAVRLYGEAGNDNITGGTVNDVLQGAAGNDTITGGAGADTITGGTGADLLTGGAGADTFVFAVGDSFAATSLATSAAFFCNGVDVITDFSSTAAEQLAGTNDVFILPLTPTNPLQTGGLGANATINANGTVQINQGVNALTAGVNNVYVSGTWNAAQSSFTDVNAGADYLVFQVTLAAPLAANTVLDITNQFELAEAVVLDGAGF